MCFPSRHQTYSHDLWRAFGLRTDLEPLSLKLSLFLSTVVGLFVASSSPWLLFLCLGFGGQGLPKWTPALRQQDSVCFITESVCHTNQIDIRMQSGYRDGEGTLIVKSEPELERVQVLRKLTVQEIPHKNHDIQIIAPRGGSCRNERVSKV